MPAAPCGVKSCLLYAWCGSVSVHQTACFHCPSGLPPACRRPPTSCLGTAARQPRPLNAVSGQQRCLPGAALPPAAASGLRGAALVRAKPGCQPLAAVDAARAPSCWCCGCRWHRRRHRPPALQPAPAGAAAGAEAGGGCAAGAVVPWRGHHPRAGKLLRPAPAPDQLAPALLGKHRLARCQWLARAVRLPTGATPLPRACRSVVRPRRCPSR